MFVKMKMNMACVTSHHCLGPLVVRKNELRLKRFISLDKNKITAFICLINHRISLSNIYSNASRLKSQC